MAAKCPACGFESADGAQWCDFCKEPFNKKKAEAPAAPQLGKVSLEDLPREALAKLPVDLLPGQDGERVPEAPKWLKPAALAFVGLVMLAAAALAVVLMVKMRRAPR